MLTTRRRFSRELPSSKSLPAAPRQPVQFASPRSEAFGYAPAVEYSWTPNIGVLLGVRVIPGGHNVTRSVTPAIAINYVH